MASVPPKLRKLSNTNEKSSSIREDNVFQEEEEADETENSSTIATMAEWKRHAQGTFNNPFKSLDEFKFKELFGLDKSLVRCLVKNLNRHLPSPQRANAIPNELKVLAALRFLISGDLQRGVGKDSLLSLSQASISRCVFMVCQAICDSLFVEWIKFPQTDEERALISNRFEEICSVPNILGSLAFWSPPVNIPKLHPSIRKFVKEEPTKAIQIVCDGDLKILNIFVSECGHQKIWNESDIYKIMKKRYEEGFKEEYVIVSGDASYDKEPWLINPEENGILEVDLGAAKTAGTQCMEALKSKFGCLKSSKVLSYSPKQISNLIYSCAILYNIILSSEDDV